MSIRQKNCAAAEDKNWLLSIEKLGGYFVSLYIATLFTGTFFNNVNGINYNRILAALALGVSLVFVARRGARIPRNYSLLLVLYFFCITPSVLTSVDPMKSSIALLHFSLYWVSFILPLYVFKEHISTILDSSVLFGFISALCVTYASYSSMDNVTRLQVVGGNDTNHLSFGLGVLIIMASRMIWTSRNGIVRLCLTVAVCLLLLSVIMLMSRTAILGLTFGLILAFLVAAVSSGNIKVPIRNLFILIAVTLSSLAFLKHFHPNTLGHLLYRFSEDRLYDNRVMMWGQALSEVDTLGHTLAGIGYFTINPHSEYIRYFAGSGVLGFFWLLAFLNFVYFFQVRAFRVTFLTVLFQNWLFLYMIIYLGTYGHNRTFWIAPVGILMIYLQEKKKHAEQQRRVKLSTVTTGSERPR